MYTEEDFTLIKKQKNRRLLCLWIPVGILFAAVIVMAAVRVPEAYVRALTALTGMGAVFCWGMFISPVRAYYKHLDNVMHGRTHTVTGAFKEMDETAVDREGVQFYPMLINVGNMDDEEDDRLLYYDAHLPRPSFEKGQMMTAAVHDKAVASIDLIGGEPS